MKVKASFLLVALNILYVITSIHVISVIPIVHSLMRVLRLLSIPVLFFIMIALFPKQSSYKLSRLLSISLPPIILLFINLLQLLALPNNIVLTHASGSVTFTAWFSLYLSMLMALNSKSSGFVKNALITTLSLTFLIGILQYPHIVMQSGAQLSRALNNYGNTVHRYQLGGIFGSANEDANGFVTLFPLALLWVENQKGIKKIIFRCILLIYFPLVLIFNGTRTALIITFPIVTTLFYWKISLNQFLYILGPLAGIGLALFNLSSNITSKFFGQESASGGTFGWRVEHVWLPAVQYTLNNSPIFGFGSRGWEYICNQLEIFDTFTGGPKPSHSGYIWAFASWGMLGLIAYVTFLSILLIQAFQLSNSKTQDISRTGKALFCSMIGYCFWAFISNVMMPQGWVILISLATLIAALKVLEFSNKGENSKTKFSLEETLIEHQA